MVIWRRYNVREGGTPRERGVIEVVQSSTMTVGHIIDPGREREIIRGSSQIGILTVNEELNTLHTIVLYGLTTQNKSSSQITRRLWHQYSTTLPHLLDSFPEMKILLGRGIVRRLQSIVTEVTLLRIALFVGA
jgi:hypothetical protein